MHYKTTIQNCILNKKPTLCIVNNASFFLEPHSPPQDRAGTGIGGVTTSYSSSAKISNFSWTKTFLCLLQRSFHNQLSRKQVMLIFIKFLVVRKQQNSVRTQADILFLKAEFFGAPSCAFFGPTPPAPGSSKDGRPLLTVTWKKGSNEQEENVWEE